MQATTSVTDWRVESLAFSPDGTRLVAASFMESHMFTVPDLKRLGTVGDADHKVHAVAGSAEGSFFVWAGDSGIVHRTPFSDTVSPSSFFEQQADIRCVAIDPNSRYVACGDTGKVARIWDMQTDRLVQRLYGHQDRIAGLALSPDAKTLATAGWDGCVRLWPTEQAGEFYDLPTVSGANQVAFADHGTLLIVSDGETIRAFETTGWTETYAIDGSGFSISPNTERHSMAVLNGGQISVHSTHDGVKQHDGSDGWASASVSDIGFLADGRVIIGSAGNRIEATALANSESRVQLSMRTGGFVAMRVIPGSDRVVAADSHQNSFITVISLNEPDSAFGLGGMTGPANEVAVGPHGVLVAAASTDQSVYVWDQIQRKLVTSLIGHRSSVTSVAFSPDGQLLVSGDAAGYVYLWNLSVGHAALVLKAHSQPVRTIVFSPDTGILVTSTADASEDGGEVRLWIADPTYE